MVDMASIQAAVGSLKAATDIVSSIRQAANDAEFQTKVAALQAEIINAQSSALAANSDQFALLHRVRELEEKIASIEAWDAEKQRYQLTDFGGETFAYVLKPEASGDEPSHRICPACYQQNHKSILQFDYTTGNGRDNYECPGCKTVFQFGMSRGSSW